MISCNYDAGILLVGVPEKFSLFPVEFNYAALRVAQTNLFDLKQTINAEYRMAE